MNWEKCRDYGVVQIEERSRVVRLFYSPYDSLIASGTPVWLVPESATWQGNNLIVRGYNPHGDRKTIVMTDIWKYQEVL